MIRLNENASDRFEFTPLESPAACPVRSLASIGAGSGDEDKFLLKRTPLEIYL